MILVNGRKIRYNFKRIYKVMRAMCGQFAGEVVRHTGL